MPIIILRPLHFRLIRSTLIIVFRNGGLTGYRSERLIRLTARILVHNNAGWIYPRLWYRPTAMQTAERAPYVRQSR
jgi:hypothetical protein